MLAVVAVDNSGEIASYSNRGAAASFCLATPGGGDADDDGEISDAERILAPVSPPSYAEEDGIIMEEQWAPSPHH